MKRTHITARILAIAVMSASILDAQMDGISISGQFRQRSELDNKDFSSSSEANLAHLLRIRLSVVVNKIEDVSLTVQLQDSRTFGEETGTLSDGSADRLDFHQAYLTVVNVGGLPLSVSLGRQELIYGNERLIGAVGWHNVGRSFDGVVLSYQSGNLRLDGFAAKEVAASAQRVTWFEVDTVTLEVTGLDSLVHIAAKDFFGVWGTLDLTAQNTFYPLSVSAFYLINRTGQGAVLHRSTLGMFIKGTLQLPGRLLVRHEIDGALQQGSVDEKSDIRASLIGIRAWLSREGMRMNPQIEIGYDWVSGDDPSTDANESFNTLYATNHKYYGAMDYFLNIPVDTRDYGLQDIILGGSIRPVDKLKVRAVYHRFRTHREASGSRVIGSEIDMSASRTLKNGVALTLGYSIFTPGELMQVWRGPETATWGYLMIAYNY